MILEFKKTEYHSKRFSEHIKKVMKEFLLHESIIVSVDLNNSRADDSRRN